MRTKWWCLALAILFPLSTWAIGDREKKNIRKLRKKILVLNYINSLELTPKQVFEIYGIAITYHRKKDHFQKECKEVEDKAKRACLKLREILIKKSEAPKSIGGPANALVHKLKDMRLAFNQIIKYHQHEIFLALTPAQRKKAMDNPPRLLPKVKGYKHWPPKKSKGRRYKKKKKNSKPSLSLEASRILRLLEQLRKLPEPKYQRIEKKLVQGRIRYMSKKIGKGFSKKEAEKEASRFRKILKKVRSLEDSQFNRKARGLIRSFKYRGLDEMEGELAKLSEKWSGNKNVKTNIGKFLLDKEAMPILKRMFYR